MVVPETICRIQSMWKHYSEYGNTFAFKPRFVLCGDKLLYKKNLVDKKEKYQKYIDHLNEIKKNDFFYKTKFKRDILTFPYTISLARSFSRNVPLVGALLKAKFSRSPEVKSRPFKMIVERNQIISMSLYFDSPSKNLLEALVHYGETVANQHGSEFLFCMVPQLQDIELIKHHGRYYGPLLKRLSQFTNILDLTDLLICQRDVRRCYTDDMYGGHLSEYGINLLPILSPKKVKQLVEKKELLL